MLGLCFIFTVANVLLREFVRGFTGLRYIRLSKTLSLLSLSSLFLRHGAPECCLLIIAAREVNRDYYVISQQDSVHILLSCCIRITQSAVVHDNR